MSRKYKSKNNKYNRSGRLSVIPAPSVAGKEPKKAALLNDWKSDENKVNKMVGRKSYAEKAKMQGLYLAITSRIRQFRQKGGRDCTFDQLGKMLNEEFPTVFDHPFTYPQNLSKAIAASKEWSNAYYGGDLTLIQLAEERMYGLLQKEDLDDNIIVSAYDKVFKYEFAKKELEQEKTTEISFSEETSQTLNNIMQGIHSMSTGDNNE